MQRAMVALVPQVVDRVMVLLVMPTWWFVCLSARGVGAGVGRLPVRVVVAVGVGAPGAWWAWLGAGARVGVYLVRVAGGLWAAGALLPCVWRFVLSGGAWPACALRGWCGVWSAWVVSVLVFGVGCCLWACRPRGVVGGDEQQPDPTNPTIIQFTLRASVQHIDGLTMAGMYKNCTKEESPEIGI